MTGNEIRKGRVMAWRIVLLVLLTLTSWSTLAARAAAGDEPFTEARLRALLAHNPQTGRPVDSVSELVPLLPEQLRRSLTWDQGSEMAAHLEFTLATGCKVYFCDPHSPWQRGSNENTNWLLSEFFPKGIDFTTVTDERVIEVEQLLNTRPRATLGFHTPAVRLDELLTVAHTS